MDLYKEILIHALEQGKVEVTFPKINIAEITDSICYIALQRIKDIVHDKSLDDEECFMKIEEIICIYESLGSDGGFRHDFG